MGCLPAHRFLYVTCLSLCILFLITTKVKASSENEDDVIQAKTAEEDLGASRDGSRTDTEAIEREEEAIKLDGLSVAEMKELRKKADNHAYKAEVDRVMKLIINSLYKNKEIFLRELISNASDALDKIRLLSLTDKSVLDATEELSIKIKADKDNHVLHITDTGIGMTRGDLIANLGTIAKSGTADFLAKQEDAGSDGNIDMNDLIGQFGVGFYSAFLVAERVVVTTKHNDDVQYIWESDAKSYSIVEDPRGNTLKRGTTISVYFKEEARDYLEQDTITNLIKKYSQFINFEIYQWSSTTEMVDEEIEDAEEEDENKEKEDKDKADEDTSSDDDAAVTEGEDDSSTDKPKTKKVEKTTWDWNLINKSKPIWTRKVADIKDEEYTEFYKAITKDTNGPFTHTHFIAEGEVSFKSLLFIPANQPSESFNKYGMQNDNIKLYVRRVFITSNFEDMLPKYLGFIQGIVDSDDLPLNVSRETLQQNKLLKVIRKKLVRKILDMIKKIDEKQYLAFWNEYSTNIKLGLMEDPANRSRLAKLLRFQSSIGSITSLSEYVQRMKDKQEQIYYMAANTIDEVKSSPFVERLLKKGYEVLYLTEAVDEYSISSIPEFDGKKFQNVAKEGVSIDGDSKAAKARKEEINARFEPLIKWLGEEALKDHILRAEISERLENSPCALITSRYGWTANMQRIMNSQTHAKTQDMQRDYYLSQKKALEINTRHPLIKELLRRVEDNPNDEVAKKMALMMYNTATLRSGYLLKDTSGFAEHIEAMMRDTLGVDHDEEVETEDESVGEEVIEEGEEEEDDDDDQNDDEEMPEEGENHDEL